MFIYLFVFGSALNQLASFNYFKFFSMGIILISIVSIIFEFLFDFKNYESTTYISYFLSLPISINKLLLNFIFEVVSWVLITILPIILFLALVFSIDLATKIIVFSILFTFFFSLLAIAFVLSISAQQFRQLSVFLQPIMTRLSSIYYPLSYIPALFLPLALINPLTWLIETIRLNNFFLLVSVFFIMIFLTIFLFMFVRARYIKIYVINE